MSDETLTAQVGRIVRARNGGSGLSVQAICRHIPGATPDQVRRALQTLVKHGEVIKSGVQTHALYSPVSPGFPSISIAGSGSTKRNHPTVVWPEGVEIQRVVSPFERRGNYKGTNWSASMSRSDGGNHTQIPSRRGDELVAHGTMMSMASPVSPIAERRRVEEHLSWIASGARK